MQEQKSVFGGEWDNNFYTARSVEVLSDAD